MSAPVPVPTAAPSRRRREVKPTTVLLVAALGTFMEFVDATVVNIAFPDLKRSFPGAVLGDLSWTISAYAIVFAALLVASGRIADLVGRKRVFLWGVGLFTFGSVLCALAPTLEALVAARVVQAVGAAVVVPASQGLVFQAFPPERRAHAVGLLSASAALAASLGPTIGGFLIELDSWRLVFLVNLPVGLLAIALGQRLLVESRSPGRRVVPDLGGALLLAVGIGLLVLGVEKGHDWGWSSAGVLGAFAGAVVVLTVVGRRTTWHRAPVVDRELLALRSFRVANALIVVACVGFFAYQLGNVLFLTAVWQYDVLDAALAVTPAALVVIVVAGPAGQVAQRFGFRWVAGPGALVWAGSMWWMQSRVGPTPDYVGEWLPGAILGGIGTALTLPVLSSAAVAAAPGGRLATAGALASASRQIGGAFGVAVLVTVLGEPTAAQAPAAFDDAWTVSVIAFLVVAAGSLALGRLRAEDPVTVAAADPASRAVVAPQGERRTPRDGEGTGSAPAEPLRAGRALDAAPVPGALAELQTRVRGRLLERARGKTLPAGAWLFRAGDAADALYVVRTGQLEVVAEDGTVLNVVGRDAVLGEVAVLTGAPRSASVRARRDTLLDVVPAADLDRALAEDHDLSGALLRQLAAQLAADRPQQDAPPSVVALVEAGRPGAAAATFVAAVADEADAPVLRPGDVPAADLGHALDAAERAHAVVLVSCPADAPAAWRRAAVRQADLVIAVACGATGAPDRVEGRMEPEGPDLSVPRRPEGARGHEDLRHADLVVLEGPAGPWVTALTPARVLPADPAALGRRLAGRSTALVLNGGGARALAALGVAQELDAAGVVPDRYAATGAGALVAGLLAAGLPLDEVDAVLHDELVRRRPLADWRVPRTSVVRGRRLDQALQRAFGDRRIEDLPRELVLVAADLRTGDRVVLRTGPLAAAVRAAISFPGLLEPVVDGDRLLVDGGIADALPVGALRPGEGPVVAVDTSAGAGLVAQQATDGGALLPTAFEAIARAQALAANATRARAVAPDVLLTPASTGAGVLELHLLDELVAAGRECARAAMRTDGGDTRAAMPRMGACTDDTVLTTT